MFVFKPIRVFLEDRQTIVQNQSFSSIRETTLFKTGKRGHSILGEEGKLNEKKHTNVMCRKRS